MAMKTPADLAELDEVQKLMDDGVIVPIMNADMRTPLGFSIRVAGPDSELGQMARTRLQDEFIALGVLEPTPAQRFELETRMLARVCIEFLSGTPVLLDKRPLESTEEDFFRLMVRFRWIRRQIDQSQGQRANFLPRSMIDSSKEPEKQSSDNSSAPTGQSDESGTSSGA